jgi:D-alanyl-D-alanine carboxypeptidase
MRVLASNAKKLMAAAVCACIAQPALAGTALVFDYDTGHVLYAEDLDQPWYPASLTKMMTAYLAFEAIRDGRASKDTRIFVSPAAQKMPPTRLGLKVGQFVSLDEALQALMMRSANDIAVAIAEALGGSEDDFVKQMNQTAARLGMNNTHFINPHGLPEENQITTARDMALLSRALLRDFPEEAPLYARTQATIHKINIGSHNALLTTFDGGDGIKTGYTCASGYNLAASATRDGHRVIAIVLGETSNAARTARAAALLENGFRVRDWKSAFPVARIDNYPSEVVGTGFEPDALMLERFRACKAPPPPPPQPPKPATASAAADVKKTPTASAAQKKPRVKRRKRQSK